jgi:hypothetical protein
MTDELLARRILALEERVDRVEATRPTAELILNTLADFRRDTADRFDRLEGRMDRLEGRMDALEARMDRRFDEMDRRFDEIERRFQQVLKLLGGDPGPS